jgi:hypothetical protein
MEGWKDKFFDTYFAAVILFLLSSKWKVEDGGW